MSDKLLIHKTMAREFVQGRYTLRNPQKYQGDINNVIYRSAWEKRFMIYCDNHPNIVQWGSEEIVIPYFWEGDMKNHRYFVDFIIKMVSKDGTLRTCLIEVKPFKETQKPVKTRGKKEKTYLNEVLTYTKNEAKWSAARNYCNDRGWLFLVLTEKELFKDGKYK